MHEQLLPALDGCVVGVVFPEDLSEKQLLALIGVGMAGDRALRKSV